MLQSGTTASGLQKIYEEGYLTCSTAVYYEGQGNEDEAMRCWRSAVQQIRNQYANGHFPDYRALSSSEKALSDSIRELEYQAQERIDLLAALSESRAHDPFKDPPRYSENTEPSHTSSYTGYGASPSSTAGVVGGSGGGDYLNGYHTYSQGSGSGAPQTPSSSGYIGGGTIPAITYNELSRPEISRKPPPVPPRLSMTLSRNASYETGGADAGPSCGPSGSTTGGNDNNLHNGLHRAPNNGLHRAPNSYTMTDAEPIPSPHPLPDPPSASRNVLSKRTSRSPNKDRQHTLRPTLRTAPSDASSKSSKPSRMSRLSSKPTPESKGASKAATLAWTALGLSSYGKSDSSSSRKASNSAAESPSKSPPKSKPSSSMQMPQRKPVRDDSASPHPTQPAVQWDSNSRRLVPQRSVPDSANISPSRSSADLGSAAAEGRSSGEYGSSSRLQSLSLNAAASALGRSLQPPAEGANARPSRPNRSTSHQRPSIPTSASSVSIERTSGDFAARPKSTGNARLPGPSGTPSYPSRGSRIEIRRNVHSSYSAANSASPAPIERVSMSTPTTSRRSGQKQKDKAPSRSAQEVSHLLADVQLEPSSSEDSDKLDESDKADKDSEEDPAQMPWKKRKQAILKNLPAGVDEDAAKNILNEIVVQGDVVRWSDIAGLEPAKKALREVVVYPFLRPDLFMGLREPATGMLLFGPPGTGKTMLARAVATESRSTFFSISASSLTSKYLGESEKLVRALFVLAKVLAPSIIFVDEIDSILSQRSGSGEHEASRRIKTEFLIQWSDLQRAAAGREDKDGSSGKGDASRVLVLAATNLPWAIDEAARRRFVRRQYIPLPETETRAVHLRTLLGQQKHSLTEADIQRLVSLTDGFSGSDITALAKDAAMGPLRSLGEALLMTKMDEIRPMELADFESSLVTIRPSVSKSGLKEYEDWAREFGERGG